MPSLATTESAADLFEWSCLALARVTLGRSVDLDLPDILSSGREFYNSSASIKGIVLPLEGFVSICGGIVPMVSTSW